MRCHDPDYVEYPGSVLVLGSSRLVSSAPGFPWPTPLSAGCSSSSSSDVESGWELAGESLLRSMSGGYVPGGGWLLSISSTSDSSGSDVVLPDGDDSLVSEQKSAFSGHSFLPGALSSRFLFTPVLTSFQYRAKRTDERYSNLRPYSLRKSSLRCLFIATGPARLDHRLDVDLVQALSGRVGKCFAFCFGFSVLPAHGDYEGTFEYIHIILACVLVAFLPRNWHRYCPSSSSTLKLLDLERWGAGTAVEALKVAKLTELAAISFR